MKYRILKDCISPFNVQELCPGEVYEWAVSKYDGITKIIFSAMVQHGFIEEIKDEPWEPERGEEYAFITDMGVIAVAEQLGNYNDNSREEMGNKFRRNSGQAEKAAEWLKAFKVLRDDTKGFKMKPLKSWWLVHYNFNDKAFYASERTGTCAFTIIQFATREDAAESINNHRPEWLTFLGIEE